MESSVEKAFIIVVEAIKNVCIACVSHGFSPTVSLMLDSVRRHINESIEFLKLESKQDFLSCAAIIAVGGRVLSR